MSQNQQQRGGTGQRRVTRVRNRSEGESPVAVEVFMNYAGETSPGETHLAEQGGTAIRYSRIRRNDTRSGTRVEDFDRAVRTAITSIEPGPAAHKKGKGTGSMLFSPPNPPGKHPVLAFDLSTPATNNHPKKIFLFRYLKKQKRIPSRLLST
jgi:hypothetical protein